VEEQAHALALDGHNSPSTAPTTKSEYRDDAAEQLATLVDAKL
jgi:hypothetical protein